jgi:hypothetical protein
VKIVAGFLEPAFILGLSAPTPHPQYFSPHPHRTRRYFFTSSPHPHRTHNIFSAGYRDRTAVAVDRKPARCGLAHAGLCYLEPYPIRNRPILSYIEPYPIRNHTYLKIYIHIQTVTVMIVTISKPYPYTYP